ncbi:MAG: sulfotransferase [Bacteroidia bacterium]|nr:sulfotransferase [Bacteroidia bacterium]
MKVSFLYGADLKTLVQLFWQQRFRLDIRRLPSVLLHFCFAVFNTVISIPERFFRWEKDPVSPVFILGHWRSGTTHLHNLMTIDSTFSTPNTFQVAFPHLFFYSEKWLAPFFDRISPGVRPMDNMAMLMSSANEEEIALASLGAPSSYLAINFPRDHQRYRTYVSFRTADSKAVDQWKKAYRKYVRKIVAKYGNDRPLVLKSPANTARVPLLLEMYPDARFIHIHRNPYETLRSTIHLYEAWFDMASFQSLKELKAGRDTFILEVYKEMHQCWFEDQKLIPEGKLLTLRFEDLKKNPVEIMETVYQFLGEKKRDKDALEAYLRSLKSYRQNDYDALPPDIMAKINQQMRFVFDGLGYSLKESSAI